MNKKSKLEELERSNEELRETLKQSMSRQIDMLKEIKRLHSIITLWIDCALYLDVDQYFNKENRIEWARKKLRKARRATYAEETRRMKNGEE